MKLWQKVFLITLLFTIAAVEITACLVLNDSLAMSVDRERLQAVARHSSLSDGIFNHIVLERLSRGKVMLSADEIPEILQEIADSQMANSEGMSVYGLEISDGVRFCGYQSDVIEHSYEFRSSIRDDGTYSVLITDYGDKTFALVGSVVNLEEVPYVLFSSVDITELYVLYHAQIRLICTISAVSACIFAVLLLFIVRLLLSPLSVVNRTINAIAAGNYSLRLTVRGGREFRELSQNINTMAESVENNVSRIEEISEGRRQFINNFAHEMKTPLTSMLGFADILRIKHSITDDERREYAGIIIDETKRLQLLSGRLLELAITSGSPTELRAVRVKSLFDSVCTTIRPVMEQHGLTLVCSGNAVVNADAVLLESLVLNLLDNAAKASSTGQKVRLDCTTSGGNAVISVTDNGVGMDENTVSNATEPFYMADKSRSRQNGGTGLGLALCVEIAKRHGGILHIVSAPGKGSRVSVTLRLADRQGGAE